MAMLRLVLTGVLWLWAAAVIAQDAAAPSENLADALRAASESGVSVVVIDTNGNVVGQAGAASGADKPATPEDADDASPAMSDLMKIQSEADKFRNTLAQRLEKLPDSINEVLYVLRASSPDGKISTFLNALFWSLVLFAVAYFFELNVFARRIAKKYVVPRIKDSPEGYSEKMPFLVFRFFMGLVGILLSMLLAYVLGAIIFGSLDDTAMQFTVAVIYAGYGASRTVSAIWRMVLSPFLTQYRIPAFNDHDAVKLYRWLWILATIEISSIMFTVWLFELGLNYDVYALMAALLSLMMVCLNTAMILANYHAISRAIRNGKPLEEASLLLRFVSQFWALAVILYMVFAWLELTQDLVLARPTSIPLIAGAYGILITIIVVYGAINFIIERFFQRTRAIARLNEAQLDPDMPDPEGEPTETIQAPHPRLSTFEDLARHAAAILAFVAGLYAFVLIWDADGMVLEDSRVDRLIDLFFIMFIGYVTYHAFRIWFDTRIAEETDDEAEAELGDEGGGSSATRLATLLPLFRNFILVIVSVTVLLIALMEIGINVSPLFAGAGVVGVAIGFGSQALVRDIFSGAFFLIDDAFRKGEYIDVGGVKGTVENISVRSFQLRHHLGPLHTIPFGEIQHLTNYSRDWVIMKLPLRVTYDTDVEKVRKLIKKLGQQLLDDPVIGQDFLQPLKSQGVVEMQDSAMIIRVKFMTKPGDQWIIRKRVFQEIRDLFEREGIKFAHREVTVRLADEQAEDLTDAQKKEITGAVQAAIDEDALDLGEEGGDDR